MKLFLVLIIPSYLFLSSVTMAYADESKPKSSESYDYFGESTSEEDTKFGLTTKQRKQVFKEIVAAEDRAVKEAEHAYPIDYGDRDSLRKTREKQIELRNELMDKYKKRVADKYFLSTKELKEISYEGVLSNWPMD